MTALWFSFADDGPCLIESVAQFRSIAPGWRVVIADDAKKPISDATLALVRPDRYMRTTFHRGSSLNGWEAVFGVLDTFREVASDGVLKVDSDTLVMNLDWLDRSSPMCGFMGGRFAAIYGMAYWMRADAIKTAQESLAGRWRDEGWQAGEDWCISCETLWHYGRECRMHTWDKGLASGWQYKDGESERCRDKSVITFGNRKMIPGKCNAEKRERVALEMAKFRRAFDTRARSWNSPSA
jgi:hypothetical protein